MRTPGLLVFLSLLLLMLLPGCSGSDVPAGTTGETSSSTSTPPPDLPEPTTSAVWSTSTSTGPAAESGTSTGSGASSTETGLAESSGSDTGGGEGGDLADCGNGEINLGEECDKSYQFNSDQGECTLGCKWAKCGDGLVWAEHEECDSAESNNDTLYDSCRTDCTWGDRCNDGIVQKPYEECDLGPLNNTGESLSSNGVPCTGCRFEARLVFLSSQAYTAKQLDGLTGADELCRGLGEDAGLDNFPAFRAWLSSSEGSPLDRFDHEPLQVGVPYVRPDGRRLADDWEDLVVNGPDAGITITELGVQMSDVWVWTNTAENGGAIDNNVDCEDWTGEPLVGKPWVGRSGVDATDGAAFETWQLHEWTRYENVGCVTPLQLFCFEQ